MRTPTSRARLVLAAAALLGCRTAQPVAEAPVRPDATDGATQDRPGPGVGQAAPPVSLKTIDGAPLSLARGKVTVLVFWATWSVPDKRELIKLEELNVRFAAAGLAIVALSIDDEPKGLAEFAKTYRLRFPIGWDAGHRIAEVYRPTSDPTTYVIDRSGIIRFVHAGYHDGEAEIIASEVESLQR
jgi:peroxiredoxin